MSAMTLRSLRSFSNRSDCRLEPMRLAAERAVLNSAKGEQGYEIAPHRPHRAPDLDNGRSHRHRRHGAATPPVQREEGSSLFRPDGITSADDARPRRRL